MVTQQWPDSPNPPRPLSEADRRAIARLKQQAFGHTPGELGEAIARHFLAAGMERAAVICESSIDANEEESAYTRGWKRAAAAIRAAKGQP